MVKLNENPGYEKLKMAH